MNFETLKDEYVDLWDRCSITDRFASASTATARKIHANKGRYKEIESRTGVPWYWVGITHAMESGCRFSTHLHNGDPLSARTRLVPAGRPRAGKPPFTWEESAVDALVIKGLHQITEWSLPRMLYEWERYNGWGYRKYHPGTLSPYLWSGTPHYRSGKYVADGKWSSSAVSGQTGAAALLSRLAEIDGEIAIYSERPRTIEPPAEPEIAPQTYPKAEEKRVTKAVQESWTITGALTSVLGIIGLFFSEAVSALMRAAQQVSEWGPISSLFSSMGANAKQIALGLGVVGIIIVVVRRVNAAIKGKIG